MREQLEDKLQDFEGRLQTFVDKMKSDAFSYTEEEGAANDAVAVLRLMLQSTILVLDPLDGGAGRARFERWAAGRPAPVPLGAFNLGTYEPARREFDAFVRDAAGTGSEALYTLKKSAESLDKIIEKQTLVEAKVAELEDLQNRQTLDRGRLEALIRSNARILENLEPQLETLRDERARLSAELATLDTDAEVLEWRKALRWGEWFAVIQNIRPENGVLSYRGLPYKRVETKIGRGRVEVLEEDPSAGVYEAQYKSGFYLEGSCEVEIYIEVCPRDALEEAAPEAVRQAVGGGCRSGWGRLLSVTNAVEAGTRRQADSGWAWAGRPGGGGGGSPPPLPMHHWCAPVFRVDQAYHCPRGRGRGFVRCAGSACPSSYMLRMYDRATMSRLEADTALAGPKHIYNRPLEALHTTQIHTMPGDHGGGGEGGGGCSQGHEAVRGAGVMHKAQGEACIYPRCRGTILE